MRCPECHKELTQVGDFCVCPVHGTIEKTEEPRPRVFLSYGRRDAGDLADRLVVDLDAEGYEIWRDTSEIRGGKEWEQAIKEGLRASDAVLAVLSPHSTRTADRAESVDGLDSVCLDEISFARFNDPPIPIVPVMAIGCESPFCIYRLHFVDMRGWADSAPVYRAGLEALKEALRDALEGKTRYRHWQDWLRPWDFSAFLDEKRQDFRGRQWLFDRTNEALCSPSTSAVMITGDPGAGKSAFVAQMVHMNPGGRVLACHCCRASSPRTLSPAVFVRSLAAMIAGQLVAYEERLDDSAVREALGDAMCAGDPVSAFEQGILIPLLSLDVGASETRVILVDALDEALLSNEPGPTIVDVLAANMRRLPPWLKFLFTSRRDDRVSESLGDIPTLSLDANQPENIEDIARFISARVEGPSLASALEEQGRDEATARRELLELSEGNFLYVREALRAIESGAHSFDSLARLPSGLNSLYQEFFKRHFPDKAGFAPARRILETLTAAREPMPEDLLAAATGMDAEYEQAEALRAIEHYVARDGGRLSIFHRSLAEWLTGAKTRGSLYHVSSTKGHERLAEIGWAATLEGVETLPDYMLAHLPSHLAAVGDAKRLVELLTRFDFIQRKLASLGPQSVLEDFNAPLAFDLGLGANETRVLNRLRAAVRAAASVTDREPSQLASQMLARLAGAGQSLVERFVAEARRWRGDHWLAPTAPRPTLQAGAGALVSVLGGHDEEMLACAISRDGCRAVSGAADGALKVWDLLCGRCLRTMKGHGGAVNACELSSDERRALSASADGTLRWWDIEKGDCLLSVECRGGAAEDCALSPDDGFALCASEDGALRYWDLATGDCRLVLKGHSLRVTSCAVSGDGGRALSTSIDETLRLWDLTTGRELARIDCPGGWARDCCLSADGRRALSASEDNALRWWDIESGQCLQRLDGHGSRVICCRLFAADGKALSGSDDRTLQWWDLESGRRLGVLRGHDGNIEGCDIDDAGRHVLSVSSDRTLRLWDLEAAGREKPAEAHNGETLACALDDGRRRMLSASADKTLRLWDLDSGECLRLLSDADSKVTACVVSSDGRRALSGNWDGELDWWDLETGKRKMTLSGHSGAITACALDGEGSRALSASFDRTLRLWNLETGRCEQVLEGHEQWVTDCVLRAREGRALSASADWTLRWWDLRTGDCLRTLEGHSASAWKCVAPPGGRNALSASWDGTLRWWNLETGACERVFEGHLAHARDFAFCGDATRFLSASTDGTLRWWRIDNERPLTVLEGHADAVHACVVTKDGRRAVSASADRALRWWNLETGECLATFTAERPLIHCGLVEEPIVIYAADKAGQAHFLRPVELDEICPTD